MDNTSITRAEHEEFRRSMELANKNLEDENRRQNRRLDVLEDTTRQLNSLTVSVEKLAQSIEIMVREQEAQGVRLETLEKRDGELWRKAVAYAVTAFIGIIFGYIGNKLGF